MQIGANRNLHIVKVYNGQNKNIKYTCFFCNVFPYILLNLTDVLKK